jgi:hypothetical protein
MKKKHSFPDIRLCFFQFFELALEFCPSIGDTSCIHPVYKPLQRIIICKEFYARYIYSLPNIVQVVKSRRMRWAGHLARMGEGRVVHRVLVGKPQGKRPLGRPRCRWEDNIKMDLQ